ncbi:Gfo/Idh/MocA family protein [Limnochorda pilosa]|uniref:Oxidoreductase n=1 Tax=Limnochorda pilosa TaxID=1555112 RepID=A0A0K2SLY1_LIMPI|nr:Gfo/Idh/MocA family oxidoreductase [Limnochorda pilosa]BAS27834.1 oxidoreductase [Limnochorda pilosa]
METPVTVAVIGAGNRGRDAYAGWCLEHPDLARVVAVADPSEERRNELGERHGIPAERRYASWEAVLAQPRLADGVVIATPDRLHVEPALRAMELGYDILLEKPIAPTREEVLRVAEAADRLRAEKGGSVTVAHVLRYTPFFSTLKRLLDQGRIGRLVSVQYAENVGYWHFAHSYVRGNWRQAATSSPMILAKSCHDMDMLRWLVGSSWRSLASFGSLVHFRAENAPEGAPARCTDGCPASERCPFDAVRFYVENLEDWTGWPVSVITRDFSREGRLRALRVGPYGRCVYRCDNDVVDHQVASIEFEGGVTAAFTVCGFTEENTRTLKLMGTEGEIRGHLEKGEIEVRSFLPRRDPGSGHETVQVGPGAGHAGGDEGLMEAFVRRLEARRAGRAPEEALTSLAESLESHMMAFAAEEARVRGAVVRNASSAGSSD